MKCHEGISRYILRSISARGENGELKCERGKVLEY